jgi:excisionase family DNA binding protein
MDKALMEETAPRALLNLNQAAHYLGVSRRHVERLLAAGTLPRLHLGRAVRVAVRDLDNYIDSLRAEAR